MLEGDISSIVISYVYQCFYTMKKKKDKSRNPRFDCAYRAYARLLVVARIRRVTIAFQSATKRERNNIARSHNMPLLIAGKPAVVVLRSGITIKMCNRIISYWFRASTSTLAHVAHAQRFLLAMPFETASGLYCCKNYLFCKTMQFLYF